jgi:plasmid stability protein
MPKAVIVRKVDDQLVNRLKIRAARHNRSAEAEYREILRQASSQSRARPSPRLRSAFGG